METVVLTILIVAVLLYLIVVSVSTACLFWLLYKNGVRKGWRYLVGREWRDKE